MPVINLPTDQRWGQLGAGLGALLGQVVQARQLNTAAQGVAQIQQDPGIPEDQKAARVLQQYGEPGWNIYTQIMKNEAVRSTISGNQARTGEAQARTQLYQGQAEQLPGRTRAQIDKDAAEAQAARARAALAPGENEKNFYEGQAAQARAGQEQATTAKTNLEVERMKAAVGPVPEAVATALAPYKGVLDDTQMASAQAQGQQAEMVKPGTGAAVAGRAAEGILKNFQSSTDTQKLVSSSTLGATSAQDFIKGFEAEPSTGLFRGITLRAWLERQGVGTGDKAVLAQAEADILQAGTLATQGGGFFSVGRYNLAKDMVPSLRSSPLANVIKLDQIANRNVADLQSRQSTEPRSRVSIQKTIDQWQKVKDWTNSYQTYQTTGARTALIHNGDQIDSGNFKVLIQGSKVYDLGQGQNLTGAQIIHDALNFKDDRGNARPIDPQLYMAALQRQGQ